MTTICANAFGDAGIVRGLIASVDCNSRALSQAGYQALTAPDSLFPMVLTSMLTIYVALLGYRLLFGTGGLRLADVPLIGIKIGAILALTLSWSSFQTLVFDVASKAPFDVAHVVVSSIGDSQTSKISPIDRIQRAYDEINAAGVAFGRLPAAGSSEPTLEGAATAESLFEAASALLMSTAGVLSIAMIAVGVLSALGPIFIAMLLFDATRGLFAGWLRAMIAATVAPMACWITTSLLLTLLEPGVAQLEAQRAAGSLSADTASAVTLLIFVFAAAQALLVVAGAIVALGFDLKQSKAATPSTAADGRSEDRSAPTVMRTRGQQLAQQIRHTAHLRESPTSKARQLQVTGPERSTARTAEAPRATRLGESYRRHAFRDRKHSAAARSL